MCHKATGSIRSKTFSPLVRSAGYLPSFVFYITVSTATDAQQSPNPAGGGICSGSDFVLSAALTFYLTTVDRGPKPAVGCYPAWQKLAQRLIMVTLVARLSLLTWLSGDIGLPAAGVNVQTVFQMHHTCGQAWVSLANLMVCPFAVMDELTSVLMISDDQACR